MTAPHLSDVARASLAAVAVSLTCGGCALFADPVEGRLDVTNGCHESVSILVAEGYDPRRDLDTYPQPATPLGPGEVLSADSLQAEGVFFVAVYAPDGTSALIPVPFDSSQEIATLTIEGPACP